MVLLISLASSGGLDAPWIECAEVQIIRFVKHDAPRLNPVGLSLEPRRFDDQLRAHLVQHRPIPRWLTAREIHRVGLEVVNRPGIVLSWRNMGRSNIESGDGCRPIGEGCLIPGLWYYRAESRLRPKRGRTHCGC